ncbi:hypothetical protein SAMN02927937_01138 [Paenimyroides aquimaris]|uniref:SRPBCC domain-containing protein n=1 Tax=Paenimyroides marinum TaxID=1159016 RepID=A0A1H6KPE2_9FLAO|nr:hypothetical protein [Paenimyroides aquimaris]SEH73718.1 hypothetical protein SAMN02927937_01138 [Paenimyroides aquimaris]
MNIVRLNISIKSNCEVIWGVLTNEKLFAECFTKLSIKCDNWAIDSIIEFYVDNNKNCDKALIKTFETNKCLSYEYYKHNSLNPILVSFKLSNKNNIVNVNLEGSNFINKREYKHTIIAWKTMLNSLKKYTEEINNKKSDDKLAQF